MAHTSRALAQTNTHMALLIVVNAQMCKLGFQLSRFRCDVQREKIIHFSVFIFASTSKPNANCSSRTEKYSKFTENEKRFSEQFCRLFSCRHSSKYWSIANPNSVEQIEKFSMNESLAIKSSIVNREEKKMNNSQRFFSRHRTSFGKQIYFDAILAKFT